MGKYRQPWTVMMIGAERLGLRLVSVISSSSTGHTYRETTPIFSNTGWMKWIILKPIHIVPCSLATQNRCREKLEWLFSGYHGGLHSTYSVVIEGKDGIEIEDEFVFSRKD